MANGTNVVVTKIARKKLAQARAGDIILPRVVGMAFSEGGVDESGNVTPPTEGQTVLNKEIYRKECDGHSFVAEATCRYECTLAETELAGKYISETALYDTEGDILCIKSFSMKGKDSDMSMTFTLDDVF